MICKSTTALLVLHAVTRSFQICQGFLAVSPVISIPRSMRQPALKPHLAAASPPPEQQQKEAKPTAFSNKKARESGIYSRPSTAIERGSGFFVPGLEGPKIRIVMGVLLLVGVGTNHILSSPSISSSSSEAATMTVVAFTEIMAVLYSLLILLQAAIEFIKQQRKNKRLLEIDEESSTQASSSLFTQAWMTSSPAGIDQESIEWTAQTYLSMTPATMMFLLSSEGILYWCSKQQQQQQQQQVLDDGGSSSNIKVSDKIREACRAAVDTIRASSSGRVALPNTHPAAALLLEQSLLSALSLPLLNPKCIVLQRIPSSTTSTDGATVYCWMMISTTDLLAAFTKQDLSWLGQLAKFTVK